MAERGRGMVSRFMVVTKVRLSALVAFSGLFGYALGTDAPTGVGAFGAYMSVLLLSMGSGALNNVQDRELDRSLVRTRHRPIATGEWPVWLGLVIGAVCVVAGLVWIGLQAQNLWAVFWGAMGVVFYNAIYTPMKRISALALFPGAVCGAIPVFIGAAFAGEHSFGWPHVAAFMVMFFWQFPHFWLIMLRARADYGPQRLPSIMDWFNDGQVRRVLWAWTFAYALAVAACAGGSVIVEADSAKVFLVTNALLTAGGVTALLLVREWMQKSRAMFLGINISFFFVMVTVVTDRL